MVDEIKPLYIKIIEDYKEKMLRGELKVDERLPSEIDVADSYSVSRITSKRAFEELEREGFIYRIKGSGSYVADRKKADITRNKASNLKIINIVLPFDSSLGRSIDLIRGANDSLQKNGYLLNIQNTNHDPAKEKKILTDLNNNGVSGIIYYPVSGRNNIDLLQMLILDDFPIITVDKYFDGLPVTSVVSDNFKGSYEAVSYLINQGHENIGYISDISIENVSSVRDRFFGYCKALKDNGIDIKCNNYYLNYIEDIKLNHLDLYENHLYTNRPCTRQFMDYFKRMLDGLIDRKDRITAIHTVNDYVAMYVLKTALDMGIKVPEELSIIGFDNIELSQHLEVPLTTIEQDFYKMGLKAAGLIADCISGTGKKPETVVIPTRFIERESVSNISKYPG